MPSKKGKKRRHFALQYYVLRTKMSHSYLSYTPKDGYTVEGNQGRINVKIFATLDQASSFASHSVYRHNMLVPVRVRVYKITRSK